MQENLTAHTANFSATAMEEEIWQIVHWQVDIDLQI
jgi:hypothetical protein